MKTLLLTACSPAYFPLGVVVDPNHRQYAARHGYDYVCAPHDQEGVMGNTDLSVAALRRVLDAFKSGFEQVVTHGIDVLFTNHTRKFESIMPGAPVVIAREEISFWPINADVIIYRNDAEGKCRAFILRLLLEETIWKGYRWGVQQHIWNLIQTDKATREAISLVPARTMNSTMQVCPSRWQLGDFICHLLDMPLANRVSLAEQIIGIAGPDYDGTFKQ